MDLIKKIRVCCTVALLFSMSQQVSAFAVWAVESGSPQQLIKVEIFLILTLVLKLSIVF